MYQLTLEDIASVQVGYQARGRIEETTDGTHRLIQGRDFDENRILNTDRLQVFLPVRKADTYLVHAGDILVQARGIDNFAYCLENVFPDTLAAGSFYILRVRGKVDITPQYLCWWINQPQAQKYFKAQASGTWMSFISKSTLSQLQVPIPPLDMQGKIVQTVQLLAHEKSLRQKLTELRETLITAVCAKAIHDTGEQE